MPKNSVSVILQFSKYKDKLYCSYLVNQGEAREVTSKVKDIPMEELAKYRKLTFSLNQYRKRLIKTPVESDEKLQALIDQEESQLSGIQGALQSLSQWWLHDLITLLNTPKANLEAVAGNEKDKKGGKDQKKKGGKDEVASYESQLPASPSGIESVTFLLDEFIYGLPFEELVPTDVVATVSKDSSLFWLGRKLEGVGFQSELNNSSGFGADKGKYYAYDFKQEDYNFKSISTSLSQGAPPLKLDGLDSSNRLPALGDYTKSFLEPGFIEIYGSVDFLNQVKLSSLLEHVGTSKTRLLLIHDNLNFSKLSLNKFKDLNTESFNVMVEENEKATALLADLLGLSVVKNRWHQRSEAMKSTVTSTLSVLAKGDYIGSCLRQKRESTEQLNAAWCCYLHGPAVIRL